MTSYRHALTGRVIAPREGSALARLVEADDQWSEAATPITGGSESGEPDGGSKATRTRRTKKQN